MNEVEKMYENANLISYYCGDDYIFEAMLEVECRNGDKEKCKTCDKRKVHYPPFTAEKQLNLIKWLSDISGYFSVHRDRYKGMYNVQTGDGGVYVTYNLSEAIASRVNIRWNDLSEKQRKQIKEILE